jgi:hypothetical protein
MKTYRIYYWYRNSPEDREGGPWWYRDFETDNDRGTFLKGNKGLLYKFALEDRALHTVSVFGVAPPPGTEIYNLLPARK